MQEMEEIYQKYARTVYRYLMSKTHDEGLSEELTQETFYQAVRSIDRFDGSCRITTWLCAIAGNVLLSWRRSHPALETYEPEHDPGISASAESEALGHMGQMSLMKQLHECPEPYREIMYLRIFGGLSFKEIGEIMGKTENWARVSFYRGKERLRKETDRNEK